MLKWQESSDGFKMVTPHEDQPHKNACLTASIRNQDPEKCGAVLVVKRHVQEAAKTLGLLGLLAVLEGRTDDQDKLLEREILTNQGILEWLCNHSDPQYRLTGKFLQVFGDTSDLWDKRGLTIPTRNTYAQTLKYLVEAAAGKSIRQPCAPAGKTLGMPTNLLFVNSANVCARGTHLTCCPDMPFKERNVGLYLCRRFLEINMSN